MWLMCYSRCNLSTGISSLINWLSLVSSYRFTFFIYFSYLINCNSLINRFIPFAFVVVNVIKNLHVWLYASRIVITMNISPSETVLWTCFASLKFPIVNICIHFCVICLLYDYRSFSSRSRQIYISTLYVYYVYDVLVLYIPLLRLSLYMCSFFFKRICGWCVIHVVISQ